MKLIRLIVIFFSSCGFISAATFGYLTQNLETEDMFLYQGTKVELLSEDENSLHVKIDSFISKKGKLSYDENFLLKIGELKNTMLKKKRGKKRVELDFSIAKNLYSQDYSSIWEEYEELYYEACTQCHSANEPIDHTMLEWEGLYGSMVEQIQLDNSVNKKILRYLKSHAKDGFIDQE